MTKPTMAWMTGERFAGEMAQAETNPDDFSDEIGVHRATVYRWEASAVPVSNMAAVLISLKVLHPRILAEAVAYARDPKQSKARRRAA